MSLSRQRITLTALLLSGTVTARAVCQLSQMSRYRCSSKVEQRVEQRIKIIILLWANNSETVSVEGLSGAENSTLLLFFRESYVPGGHMETSQILQTSICILKYGQDAENCGRIWGFVSYHSSSLIFPPSCEPRKQKTELPPTVRIKALHGEGAIKRHFEVDIPTHFKQRCARASLLPCSLLHLCSLYWQKPRVRWAEAIPVNSLPFMRRVIPRLFQPCFARACRDECKFSFAAKNLHSWLLFSSADLTFVLFCIVYRQSNEVNFRAFIVPGKNVSKRSKWIATLTMPHSCCFINPHMWRCLMKIWWQGSFFLWPVVSSGISRIRQNVWLTLSGDAWRMSGYLMSWY